MAVRALIKPEERALGQEKLQALFKQEVVWLASVENTAANTKEEAAWHNEPCVNAASSAAVGGTVAQVTVGQGPVVPFKISSLDNSLAAGGLPLAAVHEFMLDADAGIKLSSAVPHTLLSFLAANCLESLLLHSRSKEFKKLIVWIGEEIWPAPYLLANLFSGIQSRLAIQQNFFDQCLFIKPRNQEMLLWSLDQALNSKAVAAVITYLPKLQFSQSRRFALRARQNNIFTLFVRPKKDLTLSASMQSRWLISPQVTDKNLTAWKVELCSQKGQQASKRKWTLELNDQAENIFLEAQGSGEISQNLQQPDQYIA